MTSGTRACDKDRILINCCAVKVVTLQETAHVTTM